MCDRVVSMCARLLFQLLSWVCVGALGVRMLSVARLSCSAGAVIFILPWHKLLY